MPIRPKLWLPLALLLSAWPAVCPAAPIYDVTLTTAPLIGHPAGPLSLDFQLNDGSGTDDGNNTATLSGFDFNGGSPGPGAPELVGGAAGDFASGMTLTDSSFLNEFTQTFTPGDTLSFLLSLTTNADTGGTPDEFSFAILDNTGIDIPTMDYAGTLILIDLTGVTPTVNTFATNPEFSPGGGGDPIVMAAPSVTAVEATPEADTLVLSLIGAALLLARRFHN